MSDFDTAEQLLDNGEGEKAMRIFHVLAEQGDVSAMHSIAHTYLYGIAGIKQDYGLAFRWFSRAAESGCPQAMYHLGMCNAKGYGTTINLPMAFEWFMKSAENQDEDAMFEVGNCYATGFGVEEDMDKARIWYKQAADHGQKQAAEKLAVLV